MLMTKQETRSLKKPAITNPFFNSEQVTSLLLSNPIIPSTLHIMSFPNMAGGAADCSSGQNPMAQMMKQFGQDRSLQQVIGTTGEASQHCY